MPQLLFKRELFEAIKSGKKTTTLRRWKSCHIAAGDRVKVPGVGWLKIRVCETIKLSQLKSADARADGFASLADLHAALDRFYPDQKGDGKAWYRIAFDLESLPSQASDSLKEKIKARPAKAGANGVARHRLATRIRAELDKAVQRSRSLLSL
jgi:hypothetical protein